MAGLIPMRVPFTKMEGCGNDYIFVDGIAQPFPVEWAPELSKEWSSYHFGIGADGLIVLTRDDDGTLRMQMWNADGSRGAMCGNGLRCLARFAEAGGYVTSQSFVVATDSGPRPVELKENGAVRIEMGEVRCGDPRTIEVNGQSFEVVPGDAGNPHAVIFVDDVDTAPVEEVGAALQTNALFASGVNVGFAQPLEGDTLRLRVFERGSGETLACGTGAAVAARAARLAGNIQGLVAQVDVRGGTLAVIGDGPLLAIEGPARTVFTGEIELSS